MLINFLCVHCTNKRDRLANTLTEIGREREGQKKNLSGKEGEANIVMGMR